MIERRLWKDGKTVAWTVRYRDPSGRQRSKAFTRRRDAEAYEDEINSRLRRGDWLDPRRGEVTLAAVWAEYERAGTGHLRATTRQNYRAAWRNIEPYLGRGAVNRIEQADVADWIESLSQQKGPETVRQAHRVLCLVIDYAIQTRRLSVNPARGVRLPRRPPARERILTVEQVNALVERLGGQGDLVLAMAYLGLRWSELAALKVSDVDLSRRRVRVVERATEVGGRMDVSAPKSRASQRSVAIPAVLSTMLERRWRTSRLTLWSSPPPTAATCATATGAPEAGGPPPRRSWAWRASRRTTCDAPSGPWRAPLGQTSGGSSARWATSRSPRRPASMRTSMTTSWTSSRRHSTASTSSRRDGVGRA